MKKYSVMYEQNMNISTLAERVLMLLVCIDSLNAW